MSDKLLAFIAANNLVVAEYDTGVWHVKKYANGWCGCIAQKTLNVTSWVASESIFRSAQKLSGFAYPVGLFKAAPRLCIGYMGNVLGIYEPKGGTRDTTPEASVWRQSAPSGTTSVQVNYFAVGKWK